MKTRLTLRRCRILKKFFIHQNEIYSNPIISSTTRYNAKSRCAAHLIACITLDTSCSISTNRTICNTIQTLLFFKTINKKKSIKNNLLLLNNTIPKHIYSCKQFHSKYIHPCILHSFYQYSMSSNLPCSYSTPFLELMNNIDGLHILRHINLKII